MDLFKTYSQARILKILDHHCQVCCGDLIEAKSAWIIHELQKPYLFLISLHNADLNKNWILASLLPSYHQHHPSPGRLVATTKTQGPPLVRLPKAAVHHWHWDHWNGTTPAATATLWISSFFGIMEYRGSEKEIYTKYYTYIYYM